MCMDLSLDFLFYSVELPYDPAIPLLGIHTEETRIERDTCTPMFIAALFIIVRTWKQPRCPSSDEWIRKLWYIYTMEYSAKSLQSCLTRCDPVDSSPPGSAIPGILQARILEWVTITFPRIFPTQGLNPSILHCRQTLYHLSHQGSPKWLFF